MYKFITPVSGVLFSIIFLSGEGLSLNLIIALILVSIGIIIVNYREKEIASTASID